MCSACGIAGASDGVAARGGERLVGERRRVVGVDDVVRQAGMLRHLLEERLEDVGRLQLLRVGLVGRHRRLRDRQRVEDRTSMSFGLAADDSSASPLRSGRRDRAASSDRRCSNRMATASMSAFSRGVGDPVACALATMRLALLDRRRLPQAAERVPPLAHRHAPVRHRAAGILLRDRLEHLGRFGEPERVQQRDRLVEVVLHAGGAGGVELHAGAADLVGRHRPVSLVLRERQRRPQARTENGNDRAAHHVNFSQGDCPRSVCVLLVTNR